MKKTIAALLVSFGVLYLLELPGTAEVVYDLEVAFKTEMQEFHYKPKIAFNGSTTECYTELSQTIRQLIE